MAGGASVLLVGQAPGPRERDTGRFFAYTAGTRLFSWFATLGVDEAAFRQKVWIAATVRCFPGREAGGDRAPAEDEIERCTPYLERELRLLRPATVIAVGTLAIGRFLEPAPLSERVGQVFPVERAWGRRAQDRHRFDLVPLPHPSGRSTWFHRPENRTRLAEGLRLLADTPGWKRAFG